MLFFLRPVIIRICLAVFIVIYRPAANTYFSIFSDCSFGINHLKGQYPILFEQKNMKRNHRSIPVMNFIPFYIS